MSIDKQTLQWSTEKIEDVKIYLELKNGQLLDVVNKN